jgi:hypothetical protein
LLIVRIVFRLGKSVSGGKIKTKAHRKNNGLGEQDIGYYYFNF